MLSLGKSVVPVSFQPVLTCLKQDKVQTEAENGVRKLSTLSSPGDCRAILQSSFQVMSLQESNLDSTEFCS